MEVRSIGLDFLPSIVESQGSEHSSHAATPWQAFRQFFKPEELAPLTTTVSKARSGPKFSVVGVEGAVEALQPFSIQQAQQDADEVAWHLSEQGCCMVKGGVSAACCERLRGFVDRELAAAHAEVDGAEEDQRYEVRRKYFRRLAHFNKQERTELTLPMSDEVSGALRELVAAVGPVLQHFVTREGRLVDLSCMITDADCEPQPLHSDTSLERVKFTVFLALQEVTPPMGPTMLCPQTHNWESHGALENIKQMGLPHGDILQRFGAQPALCEEGDVVIMNSQLLHCGGGQASAESGGRRRRLLYVTWHAPNVTPGEHSLRDELVGQYRLGHFDQGPPLTSEIDEEYNRLFTAANKLNDADKMLEFGLLLREREDLGALAWLRRACRKGHPLACMHLAEIYCLGELGLEKDMDKAEQLRSYAMELHEFRKQKRLYEAESDSSKDSTEVSEHLAEPELPPCLRKR